MKSIVIAVLFSLSIVTVLLYLLHISIDANFISNLLNGILSNLIVTILVVFVVDRLFKRIEYEKLVAINKRNSESVLFAINIFSLNVLKYLRLKTGDGLNEIANGKVFQNLLETNKKHDWFNILYKQVLKASSRKNYLKELETIIREGATSINKSLKDVYPHPAPDLVKIVDEIYTLSGAAMAALVMSEFREEANKKIKDDNNKISPELEITLVKFFIHNSVENLFPDICNKLSIIATRAHKNRLFVE